MSSPTWLAILSDHDGEPLPHHQLADRPARPFGALRRFHPTEMSPQGRTRYYLAVGPAIPAESHVPHGVTHPAVATELPWSLDLHVLGTPPAFVLSQDQTLQRVFEQLRSRNDLVLPCRPNHINQK